MKTIIVIILISLIVLLIIFGMIIFVLNNRDKIFYFLPKDIYNPNFEGFLKKYNATKYKSRIDEIDIIDIPKRKETDKIILFLHGNYGNIQIREKFLSFLSDSFKCRIISPDYLSGREASIKHLSKINCDLIKNLVEKGVDPDNIILWGESIGCAMALEASGVTGLKNICMMCGFRRMRDMVEIILGGKLGFLAKFFVKELDNEKQIEKQIEKQKNLNLVVLHSKNDDLIPYNQVRNMVKKLNLDFCEIEGTHNSPVIKEKIIKRISERFGI